MVVAQAGSCSSDSTFSPGNSICHGCSPKKKRRKKKKKRENRLVVTRVEGMWEMGELGEENQMVQTSSYKINVMGMYCTA